MHKTVAQLIEDLQQMPQDMPVAGFLEGCGCHNSDVPGFLTNATIEVTSGRAWTETRWINGRDEWHTATPKDLDNANRGGWRDDVRESILTKGGYMAWVRDKVESSHFTGPFVLIEPTADYQFGEVD